MYLYCVPDFFLRLVRIHFNNFCSLKLLELCNILPCCGSSNKVWDSVVNRTRIVGEVVGLQMRPNLLPHILLRQSRDRGINMNNVRDTVTHS